ncbi:MAG: carbonic anhydrase [Phycisphaeraceae bacterium]|nr:carbonic anhydrase [Phycisphaeraceae bacterium]
MIEAEEALARLREGHRRYMACEHSHESLVGSGRRAQVAASQHPFAVILGCSDSRVPAELIFDQGLGDLFVIRVAGNIVSPSQIGSVEFAVEEFPTRLVVVLGHSRCGAVLATLNELTRPSGKCSENIGFIVNRIRPSVEHLVEAEPDASPDDLLRRAVRANIRKSVQQLGQESEILEKVIRDDGLKIIGAEYSLETGEVMFMDE